MAQTYTENAEGIVSKRLQLLFHSPSRPGQHWQTMQDKHVYLFKKLLQLPPTSHKMYETVRYVVVRPTVGFETNQRTTFAQVKLNRKFSTIPFTADTKRVRSGQQQQLHATTKKQEMLLQRVHHGAQIKYVRLDESPVCAPTTTTTLRCEHGQEKPTFWPRFKEHGSLDGAAQS